MADTKLVGKQYRSKPLKKVLAASNAGISAEVTRSDAAYLNKNAVVFATEAVSVAKDGTGAASIATPVTLLTYTGANGTAGVTLAAPGAAGKYKILTAVAGVQNTNGQNKTLVVNSANILPAADLNFKVVGDFVHLVSISATKWQVIAKLETPSL